MTPRTEIFMGDATQDRQQTACLARAIAGELRRIYPHFTAGHVAQDLGCTKKAAANLLNGHLSAASIARVIAVYGAFWVAERVLEAANTSLEQYISQNADRARQEQAAAEERRRAHEALLDDLRKVRAGAAGVVGPTP
jgi:hypothetical protein